MCAEDISISADLWPIFLWHISHEECRVLKELKHCYWNYNKNPTWSRLSEAIGDLKEPPFFAQTKIELVPFNKKKWLRKKIWIHALFCLAFRWLQSVAGAQVSQKMFSGAISRDLSFCAKLGLFMSYFCIQRKKENKVFSHHQLLWSQKVFSRHFKVIVVAILHIDEEWFTDCWHHLSESNKVFSILQ